MEELKSNFIHDIIDEDLAANPELRIHTRKQKRKINPAQNWLFRAYKIKAYKQQKRTK